MLLVCQGNAEGLRFGRDVLPILAKHCFQCHGPDEETREAGLRLDLRERAVFVDQGSAAVVPHAADQSELIARISSGDANELMPPPDSGSRLSEEQVAILRSWIDAGASYEEHWALLPIIRPMIPDSSDDAWASNPIDQFVLARLEAAGLQPAVEANRVTLLRRVALDVVGLPPDPGEVARFLADESVEAYRRLVDRLLHSPQYGERWGRHWLDVARYADSGGFETDIFFGHAWRYRDYVIRSFNTDKPYNQFVREQIAGDELSPERHEALLATGLYTVGPVLQEAGMVPGKLEYDQLTDAVNTTGAAFLGLTLGCARCHDHKYDPISQRNYFALQSVFAASDQFDVDLSGTRSAGRAALNKTLAEFRVEQTKLRARKELDSNQRRPLLRQIGKFYAKGGKDKSDDWLESLGREKLTSGSAIPVRMLGHRDDPLEVRLLARGELDAPGERVSPALPERVPPAKSLEDLPSDRLRLAMADWIVSERNPLTARVVVNRLWQWHFGQGLVRTPNDFGIAGERPSHPQLLDWLASELLSHDWSLKHIHRLILLSRTYRMAAATDLTTIERDPDNRLLSRFQPRRLEAETIWDSLRMAGGRLSLAMYGLPFAPPLDMQEQIGNFVAWPTSAREEIDRRAIYLLTRRSFRFPMLSTFDLPENTGSCGRRDATVVPGQALTLLNSGLMHELARSFALRLKRETGEVNDDIPSRAWLIAYGRPITRDEQAQAQTFLDRRQDSLSERSQTPHLDAIAELCLALFNTNEFIYLQ